MPMTDFTYPLGALVVRDPTGRMKGPIGKVVAQISWLGGARAYIVSVPSFRDGAVERHTVGEYDIYPAEVEP